MNTNKIYSKELLIKILKNKEHEKIRIYKNGSWEEKNKCKYIESEKNKIHEIIGIFHYMNDIKAELIKIENKLKKTMMAK